MKTLTRKEEMVMLAVLNLGKAAYLVAITDYLSNVTGKEIGITPARRKNGGAVFRAQPCTRFYPA